MMENELVSVIPSAVYNDDFSSDLQCNARARGVQLVVDVTAVPTVKTVTFYVEGYDPVSGKYYTILASAALVAVAPVVLTVYPGATVAGNLAVSAPLPRAWRVRVDFSAAGNFTFSVGGSYIL